jgi:hypothetical protein
MNYNELNLWEYKKMKTLSCFAVGLLLLSSFAALSIGEEAAVDKKTIDIQFLEPIVLRSEGYVELDVEGANAQSYHEFIPKHLVFHLGQKLLILSVKQGTLTTWFYRIKLCLHHSGLYGAWERALQSIR